MTPLLSALITMVIFVLLVGFAVWIIDKLPFIEAEYKGIAKGVILFIVLIALLLWVLSLVTGHPLWLPGKE